MPRIFNKLLRALTGTKIIRKRKVRESMEVIRLYAFLIFFFIVFYLFWFTADAVIAHRPNLDAFRDFFNSVIAGSAVIGFLSRYLVDTDEDGRPDEAVRRKDDDNEAGD
jgi:Fe2+ transport system protein B